MSSNQEFISDRALAMIPVYEDDTPRSRDRRIIALTLTVAATYLQAYAASRHDFERPNVFTCCNELLRLAEQEAK